MPLLERIVKWCSERPSWGMYAKLFVLAYAFLLRLPSEALPVTLGQHSGPCSLFLEGDKIVLQLARRKNRPLGSRLTRGCWCKETMSTCPVHVLGPMFQRGKHGDMLFPGVSASKALVALRSILKKLGVDSAEDFRTHDFRRGHTQDLVDSGAPLYAILAAGEWKSPAFLAYVDAHKLEYDAVLQAHVDESDSEAE